MHLHNQRILLRRIVVLGQHQPALHPELRRSSRSAKPTCPTPAPRHRSGAKAGSLPPAPRPWPYPASPHRSPADGRRCWRAKTNIERSAVDERLSSNRPSPTVPGMLNIGAPKLAVTLALIRSPLQVEAHQLAVAAGQLAHKEVFIVIAHSIHAGEVGRPWRQIAGLRLLAPKQSRHRRRSSPGRSSARR